MDRPTIGRIVHYVLASGPNVLEHRPAIVVGVDPSGPVNLHVFLDGFRDVGRSATGQYTPHFTQWVASVRQDEVDHGPNTWHWPERQAGE